MSAAVVVFLVCVAASAVAHLAILVSSVSARVQASDAVPRPRALVEFVWALIPILVLALLFTATWTRIRDHEKHPPETMKVAV